MIFPIPAIDIDAADVAWEVKSTRHMVERLRERHPDISWDNCIKAARKALFFDPHENVIARMDAQIESLQENVHRLECMIAAYRENETQAWLDSQDCHASPEWIDTSVVVS